MPSNPSLIYASEPSGSRVDSLSMKDSPHLELSRVSENPVYTLRATHLVFVSINLRSPSYRRLRSSSLIVTAL
jgi:hypothetical protein